MIGRVSYFDIDRHVALITPLGRDRDHDVFCETIHFSIALIELMLIGQIVEFDAARNSRGKVEAVNIRIPTATALIGESVLGALPVSRSGLGRETPATLPRWADK